MLNGALLHASPIYIYSHSSESQIDAKRLQDFVKKKPSYILLGISFKALTACCSKPSTCTSGGASSTSRLGRQEPSGPRAVPKPDQSTADSQERRIIFHHLPTKRRLGDSSLQIPSPDTPVTLPFASEASRWRFSCLGGVP